MSRTHKLINHGFPTSAFHGMRRLQFATGPGAWTIWTLEKLGLVWKVTRIPAAKQAAKAIG